MTTDGYYLAELSDAVCERMEELGANLDDPESLEELILRTIRSNNEADT